MDNLLDDVLIGKSAALQKLKFLITKIAACDTSVLISGPSGTGKTFIASLIHQLSDRKNETFIPVNCGAIPSELLESELFGHEKGAFTGALSLRKGRFELADKGTIFLDEIGDMPLSMQVKLLRVLQEHCFERIGSNQTISLNVRFIAATHQNIELAIEQNRFREDLFYRLNVLPLEIPPLSSRRQDIPELIAYFQKKLLQRYNKQACFSPEVLEALQHYEWPGNIRELMNFVERMTMMHEDENIQLQDLDLKFLKKSQIADSAYDFLQLPEKPLDIKKFISEIEKNLICNALEKNDYVTSYAAKYLKIGRTTLIDKIKKYDIRVVKKEADVIS
jgi:sigma-54 dependent transcriptional regulator, flagellar regulatory protein